MGLPVRATPHPGPPPQGGGRVFVPSPPCGGGLGWGVDGWGNPVQVLWLLRATLPPPNPPRPPMNAAVHQLSRRTFLRGVGVSMALPWLESLKVWGDEAKGKASEAPVRLAVLFSGNGFH